MGKTDIELVSETLEGYLASFEVLVRRYQKPIYYRTLNILKRHEAAEDATQETFIRAFTKLNTFDQKRSFHAWIYQIASNFCFDILRKDNKLVPLREDVPTGETNFLEKIVRDEEIRKLKEALSQLPLIYLEPLKLHYFSGFEYRQIANNLNLPLNTVRTRLRRGRLMLARQFI